MIANLIKQIEEMIGLLKECGYKQKAEWLQIRRERIVAQKKSTQAVRSELLMIKDILSGMGSLSDLSMLPRASSCLTRDRARKLQWDLCESIWEQIEFVLENLHEDDFDDPHPKPPANKKNLP